MYHAVASFCQRQQVDDTGEERGGASAERGGPIKVLPQAVPSIYPVPNGWLHQLSLTLNSDNLRLSPFHSRMYYIDFLPSEHP